MATQKQQVQKSFGTQTAGEQPARRLRLQIEALDQRIMPDVTWDDGTVGFVPPPPGDPPPTFP